MSVVENEEMLQKKSDSQVKNEDNFCSHKTASTRLKKGKRLKRKNVLTILCMTSVILNIVFIVLLTYNAINESLVQEKVDQLSAVCINTDDTHGQFEEYTNPLYGDLSKQEKRDILHFLYTQNTLNIVPIERADMKSTFIHSMELLDPRKEDALQFVEDGVSNFKREAKITILNTELKSPAVEEYVVGPLGDYNSMHMRKLTGSPTSSVPFRVRQFTMPEFWEMYTTIARYKEIHNILWKSYGATLFECIKNNKQRCLVTYKSHIPIVYSTERKIWLSFYYDIEYYSIHPVDLEILMNIESEKSSDWTIENIWYANNLYTSYEEFVGNYMNSTPVSRMNLTFPVDDISNPDLIGSLNRRSKYPKGKPLRGPVQFEPDGKRYVINGQSVKYIGWQFDWKNTLMGGPQLHNVRFNNYTIAYEIGIQDIVVMYSGGSPAFSHAAFADGLNGLGSRTAGLVPGIDCPEYASFINVSVTTEDFLTDDILKNAICIFEHNQGLPLRRHYANAQGQGGVFYGGLVANVLILRTIFVINNYDYIMDFMFYENGVFQTKVYPTGYILASYSFDDHSEFGFRVGENTIAPYHLHLFHFKVDVDILGQKNRYKTVNVKVENFTSDVNIYSNGTQYRYKLEHSIKSNEKEAAQRTSDTSFKYHLFYNDKFKNKFGEHRAYELSVHDSVQQLLPKNYGFESSIKWSRYKIAVTKRKSGEERSSSMYASFDAGQPIVDFQSFLDDNDSLLDQDLVAWLALGLHHIPRMEDIPNTGTAGKELSFTLQPFNFFNEDPSMASGNGVRITPKDPSDSKKGLHIEKYGVSESYSCIPQSYDYNSLRKDGSPIFHPFIA